MVKAGRAVSCLVAAVVGTGLWVPAGAEGIWKAFVPRHVDGAFGKHDPIGLIAGRLIPADCSVNWRDEHGHRYCFASATSLNHFLDQPQTNAHRASQAWERLRPDR